MGIGDIFHQVVGVQKETTNKHGQTKEELLRAAGRDVLQGTKEAAEAAGLGLHDAYEVTADKAGDLAQYLKEEGIEAAKIAQEKAAQAARYTQDQTAKAAAVSGEYIADQSAKAWEATQEYSSILADKAAQEASVQYQNAQELASDAARYSKAKISEGVEQIPDLTHATYELAGNTFSRFKDEAGNVMERVQNAAGEYYDRIVTPASDTSDHLMDKAGNIYQYYKDETGKEGRRLIHKAGKMYDAKTQQAEREAHGFFHSMYDGLLHVKHSIGSAFSHGKEEAADTAQQMYDASTREGQKMAHSGRQYAEDAAASINAGYENVKDQMQPSHHSSSWWPSFLSSSSSSRSAGVFDQKKWDHYFNKHKHLNADEWKAYFRDSNINPAQWVDYMDAYQKGPKGLNAFWQKAEHQSNAAKNAIENKYYSTKNNAYRTLQDGSRQYIGIGDRDSTSAAPVSLFWTAVLALYLLVLAKRVFEQKRALVSHEKDGRDTPASSAAEKMRLSDVARASNDSLSNFAIYAPATAVVLLTHELQNAASPYILHGLYAALFVGQILQNEASYASTAKARGAGIYLSWAAAGLAGAAGITTSLTGFHL